MTENSDRWEPKVSFVILNKDETLTSPGTVNIERASWIQENEQIIHFEIAFTYTPPESSGVESLEFVMNFPTEFRHIGNLYGWFVCGSGELIALDPDAPLTEVRVSMTVSANARKGIIRGVFILR